MQTNEKTNSEATEPVGTVRTGRKTGKARRIIGDILIGWTVFFTVYLIVGMLYRIHAVPNPDTYREVLRDEMCISVLLLLLALDLRTGFLTRLRAVPVKVVGFGIRIAFCGAFAVVFGLAGNAVFRGIACTASSAEYVIVLGMALENGKPNQDLLYRVTAAEDYAAKHPEVTLIVTGGNQTQDALSEAEVMKRLLMNDGVDEKRIITEDRAETTRQNFENAAKIIDSSEPVVIVTSNYHMVRAVNIARRAGFTSVEQLPAPSDPVFYGVNIMWEVIGELDTAIHWNRQNTKSPPAVSRSDVSATDTSLS